MESKNKIKNTEGANMTKIENIQPKTRKHRGTTYQGQTSDTHHAEIIAKKSIRIYGTYRNHINGPQNYDRTFKIGDDAEYNSYNFKYVGKIVAIGAKTVTIEEHGDRTRLDLYTFSWRNWNFDLEKITKDNHATSMVI